MNLQQIGEDRLLAQFVSHFRTDRSVIRGVGDDCAVVKAPTGQLTLLKTDCVVEGIHFSSRAKPEAVGWKAMMRPLSDFAAMSGVPQFALITLIVPATTKVTWTQKLLHGLNEAAGRFGVRIVGGETSAIHGAAVVSVSVSGFVEKGRCISRSGGCKNDDLFVTGRLGGSLRGKHLRFVPRIREARWLTNHFSIHAMMDLSDGLGADLPRLARASKLGFTLDEEQLPLTRGSTFKEAMNDGEDYELLFSISPHQRQRLQTRWQKQFPNLLLTRIGRLDHRSKVKHPEWHGYVHFA